MSRNPATGKLLHIILAGLHKPFIEQRRLYRCQVARVELSISHRCRDRVLVVDVPPLLLTMVENLPEGCKTIRSAVTPNCLVRFQIPFFSVLKFHFTMSKPSNELLMSSS